MSARDEIFKRLAGAFIAEDRANALIDAYAHELAERIRTELAEKVSERLAGGIWEIRTVSTAQQAADLIDPKVSNT